MELRLISYPKNWKEIIWTAARTCTSEELPENIYEAVQKDFDEEKFNNLYRHLYKSGHFSIFEHINLVFTLSGVTRSMMSQFTRHRFFGFSIQSMRYVKFDDVGMTYPEEVDEWMDIITNSDRLYFSDIVKDVYQDLLELGIHQEKAREILPIGTHTNMVFSGNLRTIMETAGNRRCVLAQDEIRELFNLIKIELTKIDPILGRSMMIKCQKLGYCPEMRNKDNKICSIRPHVDSLDLRILDVIR